MNMYTNNNNNTNNSSAGSVDDLPQPSLIWLLGVTVKFEPDVSVPNSTSIVHKSSVEGTNYTAITGSRHENPLVIPSSPSPPTPPHSPPRLSNQAIIIHIGSGDSKKPVDLVSLTEA